ncbi:unnamed protein product [Ceutorhynchus assimilis]|uniref:Uncharacterized protein n=1 Tax=Ceutorhynchus assimilis TaxID=467358 RepID=A0A9N9MJC2_9CUCU|nr:unnamed protein product [Ceutorhynchus assimilis]
MHFAVNFTLCLFFVITQFDCLPVQDESQNSTTTIRPIPPKPFLLDVKQNIGTSPFDTSSLTLVRNNGCPSSNQMRDPNGNCREIE